MPESTDYAGLAALSICEALLLSMRERGLLPDHEIVGILCDAAAAHENAVAVAANEPHEAAAIAIRQIIAGGNYGR